jgi:hypothetical protein
MRIAILCLTVLTCQVLFPKTVNGQTPSVSPTPVAAAPASPSVSPSPTPSASPSPALAVSSSAQPIVNVIPVPVASAEPPAWFSEFIGIVSSLPVVGPYVSKVIVYAGVAAAVLTSLVTALLAILTALGSAFNLTGLTAFAQKITDFKNGKIMYWLAYLSMYNATKPPPTLASAVVKA